jgi:hypothetical protein
MVFHIALERRLSMGIRGRRSEIPITRTVDAANLGWPSAEERRSETLAGNRDYSSLGRVTWKEVREAIEEERRAIDRIAGADDWESYYEEWLEEWLEECYEEPFLFGFDLGTNALSAALAAARCLSFYSCNGGAFGEGHNDVYPLVAFFCKPAVFPFLNAAAERSGGGLEYNRADGLTAFAQDVDSLIDLAVVLFESRGEIKSLRVAGSRASKPKPNDGGQGSLF